MKNKTKNLKGDFTSSETPLSQLLSSPITQRQGNKSPGRLRAKNIKAHPQKEKGLCLYDGTKLRSYDQDYIKELIETKRVLFDLKPTFDALGERIISYKGKYENLEINIFLNRKSTLWLLDISGSLHKFFNIFSNKGRQNYNDFYWKEFLQVYAELIRVFEFNPHEMDVVNLEVGVNCVIPKYIGLTIEKILENIISIWGVCRNISWIRKPNEDFFKVERGERYFKFYDKMIQNGLLKQIMRIELGYSRSRQIIRDCNAKSFFDLTKLETSFLLQIGLIKAVETIHMFHPDLLNLPLQEIEADRDVLQFNTPSFWCKLKKENRYQHDRKRQQYEFLTNKYCGCNLSKAIVEMVIKKLG